jgi:6,7-dimethyl-8-ribityllumazine synthase
MSGQLPDKDALNGLDISGISKYKFGIVRSEWNEPITHSLYEGALNALLSAGIPAKNIISATVPGTFELPLKAKKIFLNNSVDAVICLGCVIKGETPHFDFVCQAAAAGIMQLGLEMGKPCIFGVLTTLNQDQAIARSGGEFGNKGTEAAIAAIKMLL